MSSATVSDTNQLRWAMEARKNQSIQDAISRRIDIEQRAYSLVNAHCHFHRRAGLFEFTCEKDVLIVRGNVPTFYLKQVLQSALQDLEGIRTIDNRVTVISSQGVSSCIED
jgi:hypothetical protein